MERIRNLVLAILMSLVASGCGSSVVDGPGATSGPDSVGGTSVSSVASKQNDLQPYECILAQADVTSSLGLEKVARRTLLIDVFSEPVEGVSERVSKYRVKVLEFVRSDEIDISLVDEIRC